MNKLARGCSLFYAYLQILSLDVVLGACVMCYFFAFYLDVYPNIYNYLSLGLTVWLIYTLDHLLDAAKVKHEAHTARHRFHQDHARVIWVFWMLAGILGIGNSFFFLEERTLYYGIGLSVLVSFHFLLTQIERLKNALLLQKETRIALMYSLGVALAPYSLQHSTWSWEDATLLLQLGLVAWVNLLIISCYERDIDRQDGHVSMARRMEKAALERLMQGLMGGQWFMALIACCLGSARMRLLSLILALMMFTLALVQSQRAYFRPHERYRAWADGVFFFPIVLVALKNG